MASTMRRDRGIGGSAVCGDCGGKVIVADATGGGGTFAPGIVEKPGEQDDGQRPQQLRGPGADAAGRGKRLAHAARFGHQPQPDEAQGQDNQQKPQRELLATPCRHRRDIDIRPVGRREAQARIDQGPERQHQCQRQQPHADGTHVARQAELDHDTQGEAPGGHLESRHDRGREVEGRGRLLVPGQRGLHGRRRPPQHEAAEHQQQNAGQQRIADAPVALVLEHLVDAQLDLAVAADLVERRFFQPLLDGGMQQGSPACRRQRRSARRGRSLSGTCRGRARPWP